MTVRHVLVTGGAGFIGSHVVDRLIGSGDRVTVLDDFNDFYDPARKRANLADHLDRPGFTLVEGDIRDADAVDRLFAESHFDAVVHLAARAGVRQSLVQPELYEQVNGLGTLHVLEAARRHGPRDVVFGSSSSVYGLSRRTPFREDDPVDRPISPYAASKRAGELMCFNHHHHFGLHVTCLRFFTVYGPRQRPEMAIHRFTERMLEGATIPLFGDGSSQRDYTYVDDIVDGIVAALASPPGFEIVNLGGGSTTPLGGLVEALADALAVEPRIEYRPAQAGDVPITHADIGKARRLLDFKPRVPVSTGLKHFAAWYRQRVLSGR